MNLFEVYKAYQGYDKETKENYAIVISEYKNEKKLTFYSKDYIGLLYNNDKKGNKERPDYTFYVKNKISGSFWIKADKNNNSYFSGTIKFLEENKENSIDLIEEKDLF